MAITLYLWLGLSATLVAAWAYSGPDLPPGPYCGIDNLCCLYRKDSCSHKILDTLCYCDQFCNQTRYHDDCCPDYAEVCLGIRPEPEPEPEPVADPCRYGGKTFVPSETTRQGCRNCECVVDPENDKKSMWRCEEATCLTSDEVAQEINSKQLSWHATNYPQFQDKKLKEGLIYKLGTLPLSRETRMMGPIRYDKDITYPRHFDAREHWPNFISPVVDQGWCGSDWAVSIASIASDRFAIQSKGAESSPLSPQTLVSCNRRAQRGCAGGHIDVAWNFVREHGLVSERCLPYNASVGACVARGECWGEHARRRVGPPGRLKREKDIMYDIMDSGPVQAIMSVHHDLFHYRGGVYRASGAGDQRAVGLHSVRLVGWGEERGDRYWIVANSWGRAWGEGGYVRAARGGEADVEAFVVTALPDVSEAYRK